MRGTMHTEVRHIEVRVQGRVLRGHLRLARRLEQLPATVTLTAVPPVPARPSDRMMRLERLLHGCSDDAHLPAADPVPLTGTSSAGPVPSAGPTTDGLVVDLTDEPRAGLRPAFDGRHGEGALLAALQQGRLPLVTVLDATGTAVVQGRPGSEQPGVLVTAYADVLDGLATMLLAALRGDRLATPAPDLAAAGTASAGTPARPTGQGTREAGEATAARPVLALVRTSAGAVARRGYQALYRTPHWRVGWRLLGPGEPDVMATLAHPAEGWRDLPDDGFHFYADPFPFVHGDETWLFVEDFDHRVGRGVISAVGFDDHGPVGTPTTVLEHEVHLSYPFVLEHEGEVWMVPETSAAGTIELYRADPFPHRWTREGVLVEGVQASDATLVQHGGRWWMLATVRQGGSFSDTLTAWSAERLTGPWTAHPHGALLVDIASARPGGRVVVRDGRLLRPVQDNRTGYGASMLLTEITRLDDGGFDQRVLAPLGPSPQWPGRRLHTLNRAGRLEVVDGSAMSARFRRRPREQGPT